MSKKKYLFCTSDLLRYGVYIGMIDLIANQKYKSNFFFSLCDKTGQILFLKSENT